MVSSPEDSVEAREGSMTSDEEESQSSSSTSSKSSQRSRGSRTRRQSHGNSGADPGFELERRVARVEFAEGALVRLRVPVRAEADPGRGIVTDLDVVALDIDYRLRLSRSILECKSGKGQSGEPDRLLWLAGLREYVRAHRSVLVRNTVSRRGQGIAERLGIEVQDTKTLEKLENAHAWIPDRFAHVGGVECYDAESRTDTQLKGLAHIPSNITSFLRIEALLSSPEIVLSALDSLREALSAGDPLPDPTGQMLAGHGLVALLISSVTHAQKLDFVPIDKMKRDLEQTLTVGSSGYDRIPNILNTADELMSHVINHIHDQYVQSGAKRIEFDAPSLRSLATEPPRWIPRYIDLLEALRANPLIARDLPQTAELACFDAILGGKNYTAPAFDHLFTAEHRQLLRVAVRTLREIVGPVVADRLGAFRKIDFDRKAPNLPDRRARPGAGNTDSESEQAELFNKNDSRSVQDED